MFDVYLRVVIVVDIRFVRKWNKIRQKQSSLCFRPSIHRLCTHNFGKRTLCIFVQAASNQRNQQPVKDCVAHFFRFSFHCSNLNETTIWYDFWFKECVYECKCVLFSFKMFRSTFNPFHANRLAYIYSCYRYIMVWWWWWLQHFGYKSILCMAPATILKCNFVFWKKKKQNQKNVNESIRHVHARSPTKLEVSRIWWQKKVFFLSKLIFDGNYSICCRSFRVTAFMDHGPQINIYSL